MIKKLTTTILIVILAICVVFVGILVYALIPKECKHHFCNKTEYEPTCDTKGYTLYECKNCEYTFEADFIAPLGHNYSDEIIAPTCESEGYTLHTCSLCQRIEKDSIMPANGHDYTVTVIDPTCELQGCTINSCKNCDFVTRTDYKKPLGHEKEKKVIAPTCDKQGYTICSCTSCDYEYINNYVEPLGHNYTVILTVDAECETGGYSIYKCSNCQHEYESDHTDPLRHSLKIKSTVAPECEKEGYTVYMCENCDFGYNDNYTKPMGHSYVEVGTVASTCTERGSSEYKCDNCGSNYTIYTAPLGHSLVSEISEPTCTKEGYTTHSCENCEYSFVSDVVPCSQHIYEKTYIRPNIEQTGYTIYECVACGSSHEADFVFYSDIFTGSAGTGEGALAFGLDLSKWSKEVDFEALKAAGVDFVILRVGSYTNKDPYFEDYYAAAREAGLDIGVYFFTYAESEEDAINDAARVASWIRGKTFEYPIFYDVEDDDNENYYPSTFSRELITAMAHAFMTEMVDYGYYPGLYTNSHFLYNVYNEEKTLRLYDIWFANYPQQGEELTDHINDNLNTFSGVYSMWQYVGDVYGYYDGAVSGACDLNFAFKDYPTIIKKFGFNGYN